MNHVKLRSNASLALIGNHFWQPRQLPLWISEVEQPSDMFCVSNKQGKQFIILLMCGACLFCLTLLFLKLELASHVNVDRVHGCFAPARSAWYEASQQQDLLFVASGVVFPLYSHMVLRACAVISDHLRLHFSGAATWAETCLVVFVHLCTYQKATGFRHRHVARMLTSYIGAQRARRGFASRYARLCLAGSSVPSLWLL
eukprot:5398091-Amphidinium_carterae.1